MLKWINAYSIYFIIRQGSLTSTGGNQQRAAMGLKRRQEKQKAAQEAAQKARERKQTTSRNSKMLSVDQDTSM